MNKITSRYLCGLLGLFLVSSLNAQEKKQFQPKNTLPTTSGAHLSKVTQQPIPIQLTEANQESIVQTGYVKCLTDEMHQKRLERYPYLQSDAEFEAWLKPLLKAKKDLIAEQKAAGNFQQAVVNIPVIFHIISSGGPSNVSAALVQAQIDQLNLDFSNQAGAVGGIWDAVAADAEIVFVPAQVDPSGTPLVEPGINRVTAYGSGPFPTSDFDDGDGGLEIKPNTIWDRSMYSNIWSADISGGILGYAQFPSNSTLPGLNANGGSALNDGVVIGYGTIGSVANPGSAAPYNLGRTLTHEIGHWIGLRHIWGDGGCGVDDFCNDTPESDGSNFGCANPDSCGSADMVQNYMDYTDDSCMNIFTADQVLRIATVLDNADGISDLPNSTTGNTGPTISFSGSSSSSVEGSDCSYTDVVIDMVVGQGPSANATATLSVTGGTASDIDDFELMTTSVSFSAGATTAQSFTIRVYDDSIVEGDETIDLSFTVNANGGDATAGNDNYTLTISDDDFDPATGGAPIVIESDDFESGLGNWTVTGNGTSNFAIANNGTIPDAGFFNPDNSNATNYAFVNDDDCNCDLSDERMAYNTAIDLTGYTEASISLDYAFSDTYGGIASVQLSTDGGTTWPQVALLPNTGTGDEDNVPFENIIIDLAPFIGQTVNLSVHYNDEAGWAGGLIVDNFLVTTPGASGVQTAVNAGTSEDQISFAGTGTSFAIDTATDFVIAEMNNTDNSDYGCTSVSVSRAGTSGQTFNGSIAPALVTDKTFTITPTTENLSGVSTLSFYFTEAELAGWEAATSDNRSNLRVGKDNGSSVVDVSSTITAFGSNWKVTADFTNGIGGTYYFGNLAFLSRSEFTFDAFAMYPNPSNNEITIKFNTTNDVAIDLFDINGRTVLNKTFNTQSSSFSQNLNVSALATGVYIVKIKSGNNTMFRKLVVN